MKRLFLMGLVASLMIFLGACQALNRGGDPEATEAADGITELTSTPEDGESEDEVVNEVEEEIDISGIEERFVATLSGDRDEEYDVDSIFYGCTGIKDSLAFTSDDEEVIIRFYLVQDLDEGTYEISDDSQPVTANLVIERLNYNQDVSGTFTLDDRARRRGDVATGSFDVSFSNVDNETIQIDGRFEAAAEDVCEE